MRERISVDRPKCARAPAFHCFRCFYMKSADMHARAHFARSTEICARAPLDRPKSARECRSIYRNARAHAARSIDSSTDPTVHYERAAFTPSKYMQTVACAARRYESGSARSEYQRTCHHPHAASPLDWRQRGGLRLGRHSWRISAFSIS